MKLNKKEIIIIVVTIILVTVLGLMTYVIVPFLVMSEAKGAANSGTVGVQDNLGDVYNEDFGDYNDRIVTGNMVVEAISNFRGKEVAIFVNTLAMDKGEPVYINHEPVYAYVLSDNSTLEGGISASLVDGVKANEAIGKELTSDNERYYINFNALLDCNTNGTFRFRDGAVNAENVAFLIDESTGNVCFDFSVGGLSRKGFCEYLSPTAKFDSNLIKDSDNKVIGIVFRERTH